MDWKSGIKETMKQIDQELKGIDKVHPMLYKNGKSNAEQYDLKENLDNTVALIQISNCYEWVSNMDNLCVALILGLILGTPF